MLEKYEYKVGDCAMHSGDVSTDVVVAIYWQKCQRVKDVLDADDQICSKGMRLA